MKGDATTGDIDWYGVVKKIYALDFPTQKEVILFHCDWFDVPAASRSKGRGFKKDQYGIIDIDTTRLRYLNEPYILGMQAQQVFYVKGSKKPDWCTVIKMNPRNVLVMPEPASTDSEEEIDIDSLDVGVGDMIDSGRHEELTNWTRPGIEGVTGDTSVIEKALAESVPEPRAIGLADEEEEDDAEDYIDDGYVAPVTVNSRDEEAEDVFFV